MGGAWRGLGMALALAGFAGFAGCGVAPMGTDGGADAGTEAGAPVDAAADAPGAATCEAREVPCVDQSIQTLRLSIEPSAGEITTEGELTVVDARAGGRMPTESYVYARFTDRGLEKVSLHDEEALGSTAWDIAFRRSVIRLNSGVSGPSCVLGTEGPDRVTYERLTRVPPGTMFRRESYFTPLNCFYVSDGQGIGGPGTLLAGFWTFRGCLTMTDEVYLIQLRDGRTVKLQVRGYYNPEVQRACDETGEVPMADNGAAIVRLRWAFVPR